MTDAKSVTRLLTAMREGDPSVFDKLFPLVYEDLVRRAHFERLRVSGHSIHSKSIVHEAYLKLAQQEDAHWEGRAHFMAVPAKAMRHIIINHARRNRTQKRGGQKPLSAEALGLALDGQLAFSNEQADVFLALDEHLNALSKVNPRGSQVVELRFFGGLSIAETATALGLSPATVKRVWATARLWLYRALNDD